MGSIHVGSNNIKKVYVGSTEIKKVYVGSTLIWSSFNGIPSGLTTFNAIKSAIVNGGFIMYTDSTYPASSATGTKTIKDPAGNTHTLSISAVANSHRSQTITCSGKTTGTFYQDYYGGRNGTDCFMIYAIVFDTDGYMYVYLNYSWSDGDGNGGDGDYDLIDKWSFSTSSGYTSVTTYR